MRVPSELLERWLRLPPAGPRYCVRCGFTGPAATGWRGLARLEAGLWLLVGVFAFGYLGAAVIDHLFPVFPGAIVRLLSLLAKMFLALAIVYTIYRLDSRAPACANCGRTGLIPTDSPRARSGGREAGR